MRMDKIRLDKYCVKELKTRTKAQDQIKAGHVTVNGRIVKKPSFLVKSDDHIVIDTNETYVSRGAYKLLTAIEHWHIDLKNQIVLDIGASTGGFTEVCLKNGAKKVYALDVGHLQLSSKLDKNPKVVKMEGRNARHIKASWFDDKIDFICMDVSFISCKTILKAVFSECKVSSLVVLIKPQFECGPDALNHKGVLKDPKKAQEIVESIQSYVHLYYDFTDVVKAGIKGRNGNQEYVLYAASNKTA